MFQFYNTTYAFKPNNSKLIINDPESIQKSIETLTLLKADKTSKVVDVHFTMLSWSSFKLSSREKSKLLVELKKNIKRYDIGELEVNHHLETTNTLAIFERPIRVLKINFKSNTKMNNSFQKQLFKLINKSKHIIVTVNSPNKIYSEVLSFFNEIYRKYRKPNKKFDLIKYGKRLEPILEIDGDKVSINKAYVENHQVAVLKMLPNDIKDLKVSIKYYSQDLSKIIGNLLLCDLISRKLKILSFGMKYSSKVLSIISKCLNKNIELNLSFDKLGYSRLRTNYEIKALILASKVTSSFMLSISAWGRTNNMTHSFSLSTISFLCAKGIKYSKDRFLYSFRIHTGINEEAFNKQFEFLILISKDMQMFYSK